MISASRSSRPVSGVHVLDADPDLADVLDAQELEEARYALVAPAITLNRGDWSPRQAIPAKKGQLGVLVTEGILCRELVIGDSACAELVGPGDLLRPWEGGSRGLLVSCDVRWHVLKEAQLAILGRRFAELAARWPALTSALVARAVSRSHALALSATISCTTGLETRLLMLFWHMADRWGRVRLDGVVVPVQMTHELIARLIGARRPSVSTALKRLERYGEITRLERAGWLLRGDPPKALVRCGGDDAVSARDASGQAVSERGCDDGEAPPLKLISGRGDTATVDARRSATAQSRSPAPPQPASVLAARKALVAGRSRSSMAKGVRRPHPALQASAR